jgi:succinyl-diaminopimelate desuccinylase
MINCLSSLVAIPSVKAAPEGDMPYGRENARVLAKMLELAKDCGFTVTNHENYVGTVDMNPNQETKLGVLCHLDVVPEGTGWKYPPYNLTLSGGRLYGRGSSDDKGPAVAVLFALKALKECGCKLSKNVRMIVGTDEECGSSDLVITVKKKRFRLTYLLPMRAIPLSILKRDACPVRSLKRFAEMERRRSYPYRAVLLSMPFRKKRLL